MAALLHAPTTFCLLNNPGAAVGPQEFSIADKGDAMIANDLQVSKRTMTNASPSGVTPLSDHVNNIRDMIMAMADALRDEGRRVAIILATDGLPTDARGIGGYAEKEMFIQSLRSLEGLPCWIVVRLCTDDEDVVEVSQLVWNCSIEVVALVIVPGSLRFGPILTLFTKIVLVL